MKSFMAALRQLVLPWGKTSGTRIDLDGVNGRILFYDADGELIMSLAPVDGTDASGNEIIAGVISYAAFDGFMSVGLTTDGNVESWPAPGSPDIKVRGKIEFGAPDYDLPENASAGSFIIRCPDDHDFAYPYFAMNSPSLAGNLPPAAYLGISGGGDADLSNAFRVYVNGFLVRSTHLAGGSSQDEDWNNVVFQNGWTNWGDGHAPVGYLMDALGFVNLRGVGRGGTLTDGTTIFTLPEGYRPEYISQHHVYGTSGSIVNVQPDGQVKCYSMPGVAGSPIALDGIRFPLV